LAEINRAQARRLFDLMVVEVDPKSIRLAPRQHKANILFCGYADFIIGLNQVIDGVQQVIPWTTLCGNAIKLMNDKIHFDPKGEKGKKEDPKTGKIPYYPVWFPRTAEARAVFNAKITRLPEIQKLVEDAVATVSPAASTSTSSDNPF
jgi:hypothetical protein